MIYKLLAVNIDGTLLQSNGRLTKATKEAIAYVQSKGVAVVLVTSRNIMEGMLDKVLINHCLSKEFQSKLQKI